MLAISVKKIVSLFTFPIPLFAMALLHRFEIDFEQVGILVIVVEFIIVNTDKS